MKVKRFEWTPHTSVAISSWTKTIVAEVNVDEIFDRVVASGDSAVIEMTNRFDATERPIDALRVDPAAASAALAALDPDLRNAFEIAAANIRAVAEAQLSETIGTELPQGQSVTIREVPVSIAGIYAPGGRAAYPSSVLMCAIPARVAGVKRLALASPPGPEGEVNPLVLAAAELCGIDEIYAMGGAQAIFAFAQGTESVPPVDVVVGPGNAWVRAAKKQVAGRVGIDSFAGPSELMVIAGHDADAKWIASDLCAQAEHGEDSTLIVAAVEERVLEEIKRETESIATSRASVSDAPLALVQVPSAEAAIDLANDFAPEHLELMEEDAGLLAGRVTTAGCVFVGRYGATAFGDYIAGSNHVLPTGRAGRFSGPLGPGTFRRKISIVEVSAEAAAKLAPYVDTLARAEGFPVHGESAMIRSRK
ncbi:MAG TPA: histidinol dehydrogenase [Solirubrobacterales bacterium]